MLSILMSVKNEARYIESALRSIEPARHLGVEVVVVDDGSTDDTLAVIDRLALPFVKLIRTDGIGKAAAFSLAYEQSSGAFFILLAGDDLLVADILEKRISPLIDIGPSMPAVSFCKLKSFSEHSKYHDMVLPKQQAKGLESGGCIAFNRAFGDHAFPIPTPLANEDSWLMLQVRFFDVLVSHVPMVGLRYRIHENNSYKRGIAFSQVNEQMWLRQRALFYFYEKYRTCLSPSQQRQVLCEFALQLFRYLGSPLLLMLLPGCSLKAKIKVLFNSRPSLYWIREKFYKFFSGR